MKLKNNSEYNVSLCQYSNLDCQKKDVFLHHDHQKLLAHTITTV